MMCPQIETEMKIKLIDMNNVMSLIEAKQKYRSQNETVENIFSLTF